MLNIFLYTCAMINIDKRGTYGDRLYRCWIWFFFLLLVWNNKNWRWRRMKEKKRKWSTRICEATWWKDRWAWMSIEGWALKAMDKVNKHGGCLPPRESGLAERCWRLMPLAVILLLHSLLFSYARAEPYDQGQCQCRVCESSFSSDGNSIKEQ